MMVQPEKPLVVALMGPTASGKTAAALEIARHIPSEIISVDSALVYRGMDIGTAKPSAAEQAAVVHHLIDILDPAESYSAAQFRADTLRLCADILARGKLPLLVGGTMLYFKALEQGLDALPVANPAIRAQLDDDIARLGIVAMHARLAQHDPETAARLPATDTQRIQRAMEIFLQTGQPMSALLRQAPPPDLPFTVLPLSLEPGERSVLHARIAQRFHAMLEGESGGLIAEVRRLRARDDLHLGLPSMRCVGYRQTWEYLDGLYDLPALREKSIAATRQLAKRQLTWLRATPQRKRVDCLDPAANSRLLRHIADARTVADCWQV